MDDEPRRTVFSRVKTGVGGLDQILGGGLFRGGIYILQGSPGAGKTIFSNQLCFHHVAEGGRALFVTILAENFARMIGNLSGLSFFEQNAIPDKIAYLSAFHELRNDGLVGLVALLRREIQRLRATMLVLDGLAPVQATAESDTLFKQFIHDLQEIALATDCTILLTTNIGAREVPPEQTMVDGLIELTDRQIGWQSQSDLRIKKFRGGAFLRGRHAYRITDDGFVVFPRLEELYATPTKTEFSVASKTSTGIDRLDAMLGGGLPASSTTMVMGPSGTGKTTTGLQFLSKSTEREPGLMFSFYETLSRLAAKAEGVCRPLLPLVASGAVELLWQSPTRGLLDEYGDVILKAVDRRGVKRLFIDSLTSFREAALEPERLHHFFPTLGNELRARGVTTLYSLETSDILGPAVRVPVHDVSSLAENMILLRYHEVRSQLFRLVSVLKMRDSAFDPSIYEFVITRNGVEIPETVASTEPILATSQDGRGRRASGSREGGVPISTPGG